MRIQPNREESLQINTHDFLLYSCLPSGIITFMFSDIQGSTPLWEQNPDGMRASLARHNAILHEAVAANGYGDGGTGAG